MRIESIVNQCFSGRIPEIIKDYKQLNSSFKSKKDEISSCNCEEKSIFVKDTAEENTKKDSLCGKVLTSVAILNGPATLDDLASAYKQVRSGFKDNFQEGYDYKKAQHPYSFFRGTIMNDYLNPNSSKCFNKKFAKKVIMRDKSLIESRFGGWILKKMKLEEVDQTISNIETMLHTTEKPDLVEVKIYKSPTKFGDITARALTRTPVLGLATLGGTKLFHAGHRIIEGEDPIEELKNATIDFCSTATAVGYLGAIGAKKLGVFGSLLGTALGGFVGDYVSESLSSGDK